jgi:beta-1,4-mannosyl-glycoprotein beta-1,4-N-acetylglucosaminyltransferase
VGKLRELSMITPAVHHRRFLRWFYWKCWIFHNSRAKGLAIRLIDYGGWHFSFLGGVERIIEKLEAFSHVEYNKEEFKDPQKIQKAINSGRDILGRGFRYRFIPLDSTFPEYLLNNMGKYKHLIRQEGQP